MDNNRSLIAKIGLIALVFTLVGCSESTISPTGLSSEVGSCSEYSWQKTAQNWAPAEQSPQGFREVCIDESNAISPALDQESAHFPVTLTDADGASVRITSAHRVLALDISGSLASTVVALGAAAQLVGRDTATTENVLQQLPVVTTANHVLNVESILATRPDVVVTDGSIGPMRVLDQLRDLGVAVVMVENTRGLSNDSSRINLVAQSLGIPISGEQLASALESELSTLKRKIAEATSGRDKPRVVFLYLRGSAQIYYLLGEQSGVSDLVEYAGGIDVAREQGIADSVPLTSEALLALQPDVILTMSSGLESVGSVAGLRELLPQLSAVKAIEAENIIAIPDKYALKFSTYSPAVVMALASALFGNAEERSS